MKKNSKLVKVTAALLVMVMMVQFSFSTVSAAPKDKKDKTKYNVSEVIVKFKDKKSFDNIALSAKLSTGLLNLHSKRKLKAKGYEVIDAEKPENIDMVMEKFSKYREVDYIAPNYKLSSFNYTDEPSFNNQWGLKNEGQSINGVAGTAGADINAIPAWDIATGTDVVVGVMDTGIDISHPDLQGNIYVNTKEISNNGIDDDNNGLIDDVNGWDFANKDKTVFASAAEDTHGTNVAGVLAASNNSNGIIGAASGVKILPLKILKGNVGSTSDAIDAIFYAKAMGVKIMNCSWGSADFNYALKDAINNSGMTFICSAGNEGVTSVSYPAAFGLPNIVSVGAIDNKGNITDFTSKGTANDVYAPGKSVYTTLPNNSYGFVDGTSFSAPFVSGVAALIKQAVPNITYEEMALALKNGYKTDAKVKTIDAHKAITDALPLNYIKDKDGRLSRAMRYAKMLITPAVAEIFAKYSNWNELNNGEKTVICSFFKVTVSEMADCQSKGLDIIDSAIVTLAAKKAKVSVDLALQLLGAYNDNATFDSELEGLAGITEKITLSQSEISIIINLMKTGNKAYGIATALVVAKAINGPLADVIRPLGEIVNGDDTTFSGDERTQLYNIMASYNVDLEYIVSYLTQNNIYPSTLAATVINWQKDNKFYVTNGKIKTAIYDATMDVAIFNKYTASQRDYWTDGTINIDSFDGMVYYNFPMQSLQGRNGLNLDLGFRFDSEVADATKSANESDLLKHKYMVNVTNTCYSDSSCCVRYPANDSTEQYEYTNYSDLAQWNYMNSYSSEIIGGTTYYFIKSFTTTSIIDTTQCSTTQSNFQNYYDKTYGLGVGIALNFPSVEINGSAMNLHLPDNRKFRISSVTNNNVTTYTLDGYYLKDLNFGTATDFTVNGVTSAYYLSYKDGKKDYFSSEGKYLGTKDIIGNKIQVYYDANGLISKVYDTAGRYILFNYTTNTGVDKTVTLSLVDNDAQNPETKLLYTLKENYNSATEKYLLSEIKDAENRTTVLDFDTYTSTVHLNARNAYSNAPLTDLSGYAVSLSGITHPTGYYSSYTYEDAYTSYNFASKKDYKRISLSKGKTNKTANDSFNSRDYDFEQINTYSSYGDTSCLCAGCGQGAYEDYNGIITRKSYTGGILERAIKSDVQKNADIHLEQYFCDLTTGLPLEIFSYNFGDMVTENTNGDVCYTWDEYGNVLYNYDYDYSDLANYKIYGYNINIYNENVTGNNYNYNVPSSEYSFTKYENENTYAIKKENSFNASKQLIKTSEYTCNLGTSWDPSGAAKIQDLSETYYTYDQYGNIATKLYKDLTYVPAKETLTTYTYDNKYHIYPIKVTTKGDDRVVISGSSVGISFGKYTVSPSLSATYTNPNSSDSAVSLNDVISNVEPGTTVQGFINNINKLSSVSLSFKRKQTQDTSVTDITLGNNDLIATGDTLEVTENETTKKYNILIIGDVNGSGTVSSLDAVNVLYHVGGKSSINGLFLIAADANGDQKINSIDALLLLQAASDAIHINQSIKTTFDTYSDNTYNIFGKVTTSKTVEGATTEFAYNNVGDLTQTTYPKKDTAATAPTASTSYDYINRTVTNTAIDGSQTKTTYNTFGLTIKEEQKSSTASTFDTISENVNYDSQNRLHIQKQYYKKNNVLTYNTTTTDYDILDRQTKVEVKNQANTVLSSVEYEYDITQISDYSSNYYLCTTTKEMIDNTVSPVNYKVTKTYTDNYGRTIYKETFYDDTQNQKYTDYYVYGCYNHLTDVIGETVDAQHYTYDYTGNQVTSTTSTNATVTKKYDASMSVVEVIDPNNQTSNQSKTIYEYDGAGRVTVEKTPFDTVGQNTVYKIKKTVYNGNGQVEEVKQSYDVDQSGNPLFNSTKYSYDISGNLTCVAMDDGKGNKTYTQYYYDTANRKLRQYTGLNAPLTINGLDNVVSGGDNSYSVTKYAYDSNGNLESYTDPTGHKESYEYDYNNRIKTKTLRNGKVMSYDYYDSGALHTVSAKNSANDGNPVTHTYTYNMANWLKTAEDENGTTAYDYDDLGRLTSEARGTTYAKGYDYYSNSSVKTFTFSKNSSLLLKQGYTYYSDGKLHNANVYNLANTDNIDYSLDYAYDSNGNLTDKTYTAGTNTIEQEFAYNLANVVKSAKQYTGTTLKWQEDYTYRIDGNMTDKRDYLDESTTINKNTVYAYDALGRLENETYKEGTTPKWTNAYTFDDYNNRATMLNTDLTNNAQKATYYTYNRANQLVREETTLNGTTDSDYTYRYDAGGNMLAKEKTLEDGTLQSVMSNTFDKFNRVASTTVRNDSGNNVTTSFAYDSNDLRISKTTSGTTTNQIWNGDNIICDDVAGSIRVYIQGLDTEAMITANGFYANIYNGRGDVVETHQLGGSTIEDYQYDAFGNNKSSATYTISNPYRYSGEYTDSETGLQYLRARYYDPSIGRFTQEDTYWGNDGDSFSANLYAYCYNNPVMYADPSGHYVGQDGGNSYGGIFDPIAYLQNRYGGTAKLDTSKILGTESFVMSVLDSGGICSLTAITRVLSYYRNSGYNNIENGYMNIYKKVLEKAKKFGFSYKGGTNPTVIDDIAQGVLRDYGYSKAISSNYYIWTFENEVKSEINSNRPVIMNIARGYYGNHTVTANGYAIYKITKKIFGITFTDTKRLIAVYDGWYGSQRYIDYDAFAYDLINSGFGSFTKIKIN